MFNRPQQTFRQTKTHGRLGLSLLEVLLALAILGIASAILAQALKLSADNGVRSELMTQAQLICESKMAEVVAGLVPIQPTSWTSVATNFSTRSWYYQMQTMDAEQSGMLSVQMMVTDDPDQVSGQAINYKLSRWVIDPNLALDVPTDETTSSASGTTSASSGASASGGASR